MVRVVLFGLRAGARVGGILMMKGMWDSSSGCCSLLLPPCNLLRRDHVILSTRRGLLDAGGRLIAVRFAVAVTL